MSDLIKIAKAWGRVAIYSKATLATSIMVGVLGFAFGDGGTFTVTWAPGGAS